MKIQIDKTKCLGCGSCSAIAETVFSTDSGIVTVIKDPKTLTEEEKKLVKQASDACPCGVIEVIEK